MTGTEDAERGRQGETLPKEIKPSKGGKAETRPFS